jgi:hypothetical protein
MDEPKKEASMAEIKSKIIMLLIAVASPTIAEPQEKALTSPHSRLDVRSTIDRQEWVYEELRFAEPMNILRMAAIPNIEEKVLVQLESEVLVLDLAQTAITERKSLGAAGEFHFYPGYTPHFLANRSVSGMQTLEVTYYQEGLQRKTLRGPALEVTDSLLRPETEILTLVFDPKLPSDEYRDYRRRHYRKQKVYRFRLTDNLALDQSTFDKPVHLILLPETIFAAENSPLGRAECRSYGKTPNPKRLENFNLKRLQARFRKNKT